MTERETLKLALEALEHSVATCFDQYAHEQVMSRPEHFVNQTIAAIKEALAQPDEQLLISNILSHYGLQAIDFVADFKKAMKQAEQDRPAPCAKHCEATAFQITIKNLKAELAQTQEQEPVAYTGNGTAGREANVKPSGFFFQMPPQRKPLMQDFEAPLTLNGVAVYPRQKPLSYEQIEAIWDKPETTPDYGFVRAIEAAHGING